MSDSPQNTTAPQGPPPPPERSVQSTVINFTLLFVFIAVLVFSWRGAEIRPLELWNNRDNMWLFASGFFRPDFTEWKLYLREMVVTVQIAIWGTLLAVVLAVPFGLLSSSNIVPVWVVQPTRRLMDAARAINEMIFAILFIVAVGAGPFAGVMALFIHTMGTLSKLFSEAVEAIDPRPVEGIRATGAHPLEEILYGVIPQVMPLWVSYTLYRFESNVRSASILGLVGAGGIGYVLNERIKGFNYSETAAILLIVILTVVIIDQSSSFIRKRFI